jgi:pilus assembly protein CpaB
MKPARLVVVGIALAAGGAAALLSGGSGEAPPVQAPVASPAIRTTDVLVAAVDVPIGARVTEKDLRWQAWPQDAVNALMVARGAGDIPEFADSIARAPFLAGEPIRREKLIKGSGSGFLAAVLPSGKRALAINIDGRGASTAGGFVLPNDFVDVVRTYRDDEASKAAGSDVIVSETVLQSVKVLAIGQNIQERNGEKVVVGETATLELEPRQVETIALAQRVGQLTLALRSMADANKPVEPIKAGSDAALTVVRFGVAATAGKR